MMTSTVSNSGPAVLAEGLCKSFGATKALDDVDLRVDRAKVVGLLGPNGAGKTTAVRVLTTLVRPDRGRAFIDGIDVVAEPMRAKSRIGLTGQYAAVDERLTGFENLEHVGRLFHMTRAVARDRGRELLDRFDLVDAADRVVKGYSGGMRRRLDIAMSLIARPSVLFLDEPTTGLDPRSRQSVWELIEELVRGGTTTLLTTQYLDEADRLADEIVVIDHGRVIARGTSDVLKAQLGGDVLEVTVGAEADIERFKQTLAPMACGEITVTDHEHGGGRTVVLPVLKVEGVAPVVVRALDEAGLPFSDVAGRQSTLDDVFFSLTGHAAAEVPDPDVAPTPGAAKKNGAAKKKGAAKTAGAATTAGAAEKNGASR
jgi:ABC-2 type transport system ATP-binding protein